MSLLSLSDIKGKIMNPEKKEEDDFEKLKRNLLNGLNEYKGLSQHN
jgi:hypothetical protein